MDLIYKKADITDIELLTTTRIEVLRAANNLSNSKQRGWVDHCMRNSALSK